MRLTRRIALPALLVPSSPQLSCGGECTWAEPGSSYEHKGAVHRRSDLVEVGTTLTEYRRSWSGTQPITFHTAWMRCNANAEGCKKIANILPLDTDRDVDADGCGDRLEWNGRLHDPAGIRLPAEEPLQRPVLRQGLPEG